MATTMQPRAVEIDVTSMVTGQYEAKSYPDRQTDPSTGLYPLYKVPVNQMLVNGTDATGKRVSRPFKAPRFMPYFNDAARPSAHYHMKGWLTAGLSSPRRVVVCRYLDQYRVQNRYSPGIGAIVVHESFFIHAGPASEQDYGFGSAGCIEIIGDFNVFKKAIADLSGLPVGPSDVAIKSLIESQRLVVNIRSTTPPVITRNGFSRRVSDWQ